ncbi:Lin1244/Lin1753 domain-containing protein [Parabacteroides segnis]|uniref:DUF7833 domain-containing protein n=1 Tax=Parabacteroides segnis TaxID=2763058 RepID=UPI003518A429
MNNYFPHDSNARNSDKLIPLRIKKGTEGYGVYFMILERLREEPDYTSIKDYNTLAFDFRVGSDLVKSVVEEFGLFQFTEDGKRFYSEGFTARMQKKDEKSNKARESARKRWENKQTQSKPDANALQTQSEIDASKGKETKLKETKGEKEEEITLPGYSSNDVPVSLAECKAALFADIAWMETICMNNYIPPEKHRDKLDEFFRKLENEKVDYKSVRDAIQHYSNWLKNELNREQRYGQKVKPGNDDTERKRRIIEKFQSSSGSSEAGESTRIDGPVW